MHHYALHHLSYHLLKYLLLRSGDIEYQFIMYLEYHLAEESLLTNLCIEL